MKSQASWKSDFLNDDFFDVFFGSEVKQLGVIFIIKEHNSSCKKKH